MKNDNQKPEEKMDENKNATDYSLVEFEPEDYIEAMGGLEPFLLMEPDPSWSEDELEKRILRLSGDVLLDCYRNVAYRKGNPVACSQGECRLLMTLMESCHSVVNREILCEVYERTARKPIYPDSLSKVVHRARQKFRSCVLEKFKGRPYIVTLHGTGYKWNFPMIYVYIKDLEKFGR